MEDITINESTLAMPISISSEQEKEVSFNYIIEIQKLVAQIFQKLGDISANDHQALEKMKQRFMNATLTSANLQSDYGRTGRNIGIAAFAIFIVRLGLPNSDDREIMRVISDQVPNVGSMFQMSIQAKRQQADGEASLELEKYRSKTASRQSEGNAKQDCIALLQAVAENQKSASRSNA
ncbi:MAG: hypothetical protein FJZ64_04610 [Chlamydiae bacterium]|nr:hypothetical protein [Chlamydiota bacterium]